MTTGAFPDPHAADFGGQIRAWRQAQGLSQESLACPPCPPDIAMAAGKSAIESGDVERVRVLGGRLGRWAK